jgi:hypothetical protein
MYQYMGQQDADRSQYADAGRKQQTLPCKCAALPQAEINNFGTINKRQWSYNHTNLTGLEKSKRRTQFSYVGL